MIVVVKRWVAASALVGAFLAGGGTGLVAGNFLPAHPLAARAPKPSSGSPLPRPVPGRYFRVAPDDTLSEISQRAYGTTKRVPDLLAANPGLDPARLRPGTLLYVPRASEKPPESAPETPARPR
jgi:hypothetical protein